MFPSEILAIFISTGENGSVTVGQMLKFISGLEQVPPLGLPNKITVKFKYFCSADQQLLLVTPALPFHFIMSHMMYFVNPCHLPLLRVVVLALSKILVKV